LGEWVTKIGGSQSDPFEKKFAQLLRNFRNGYFKSIRDPKKYRQIKFFFPFIGLVILVSLPAHQATSALHKD